MKIQEAIELLIIVHSERYSTRKLRKIERKLIQNQEILEQIIKKVFLFLNHIIITQFLLTILSEPLLLNMLQILNF